jgi:PAS domain S-box-containing protein
MEKSGKVSGSKPREMGKSENKNSELGLPAIDASQNKRNQRRSKMDSDDRYRLIVQAAERAGHGIVILQNVDGKEGVITFANRAAESALGYGQDELLGIAMADIIHPDSLPLVAERYRLRQSGKGVSSVYESKLLKRDGTVLTVEVSAVTTTTDGRVASMAFVTDVSGRKLAEDGLRESEEKYRHLVENINAVVYSVDQNGVITYMSPMFESLLRRSTSEFIGKKFADFIHPEDLPASMGNLRKLMSGSLSEPWECRMVLPGSGDISWVQGHNRPVYKDGSIVGFQGVGVDITAQKQAEEALQLSEKKYRTMVEASPDGIISVDPQGYIVDCNTGICKLLGYMTEELKGTDVNRVVTRVESRLEAGQSFRSQIDQHGFAEAEMEMVQRNGHKVPVWAKMVELKGAKQGDFQILVYIRDMEERKKVDELKDQFIGLVSHELRTPLTVIMGAVNTALSEAKRLSPQETHRLLEDAASASDSLSHILENLLELSKYQADRLTLQLEPLMLEDVVQKTIYEARRHSSMHQFVIDLPKTLPLLRADRIRLERILHNLVENAVKYSPGGEVRVSARQEGKNIVVEVRDQGPGIPLGDQAKLFQPFQRTRQAETDGIKGVGLGLLVCRRLVEAHGGRIWLESKPGQVTTFFFTLPVEAKRQRRKPQRGLPSPWKG